MIVEWWNLHRLRLDISSSNVPHYDVNPNSPEGSMARPRVAENRFCRPRVADSLIAPVALTALLIAAQGYGR